MSRIEAINIYYWVSCWKMSEWNVEQHKNGECDNVAYDICSRLIHRYIAYCLDCLFGVYCYLKFIIMDSFNPTTVRVVAYSLRCNLGCDQQFLLMRLTPCTSVWNQINIRFGVAFQFDTAHYKWTSRVPVEGKSPVCLICMKYRIIILIIKP